MTDNHQLSALFYRIPISFKTTMAPPPLLLSPCIYSQKRIILSRKPVPLPAFRQQSTFTHCIMLEMCS